MVSSHSLPRLLPNKQKERLAPGAAGREGAQLLWAVPGQRKKWIQKLEEWAERNFWWCFPKEVHWSDPAGHGWVSAFGVREAEEPLLPWSDYPCSTWNPLGLCRRPCSWRLRNLSRTRENARWVLEQCLSLAQRSSFDQKDYWNSSGVLGPVWFKGSPSSEPFSFFCLLSQDPTLSSESHLRLNVEGSPEETSKSRRLMVKNSKWSVLSLSKGVPMWWCYQWCLLDKTLKELEKPSISGYNPTNQTAKRKQAKKGKHPQPNWKTLNPNLKPSNSETNKQNKICPSTPPISPPNPPPISWVQGSGGANPCGCPHLWLLHLPKDVVLLNPRTIPLRGYIQGFCRSANSML